MYHEHFGLTEAPFRITPHTEFFFAGANRGATLEALIYAITRDEGIVKVSGEVGSGKTMLCRMLMERLPANVETVYFANPLLSKEDILFAIADDLHVDLPRDRSSAVLRRLQEHLIARYAQGRQVVLLVDEAHAMPADTLEEIRLLSNLESDRHKLLQIVLFGQPELDEVLGRPAMRQLKDRITHHFTLEPLVRSDVAAYIDFRMRAAGYRGPEIFSPRAVARIARASGGLTRRINILADKALLAAFAGGSHRVDMAEVKAALRDARLTDRPRWLPWLGAAAAVAVALALAIWLRAPSAPATAASSSAEPPAAAAVATTPAPAPAPVAATAPAAPAAVPLRAATADNSSASAQSRGPSSAGASTAATAPRMAVGSDPQPAPPPPHFAPAGTGAEAVSADAGWGPQTRIHLDQAARWLPTVADEHWFIQLLTSDADDALAVEGFMVQAAQVLDARQLRAYQAQVGKRRRLGVIYGDYASRAEAEAAMLQLPGSLRVDGAYPRQVRRLR